MYLQFEVLVDVHAMISVGGNLDHVVLQADTSSREKRVFGRGAPAPQEIPKKFSIAILTPWNQQCGNASRWYIEETWTRYMS